ncbi:SAC3/GANP/Nin1/mts3/eIF-3 p25 family-domain-containing protein [Talaromyces proteolyticus]|uniref:SAC3/GANP/Nin1/mts3/eIF-3 p25 family-domain-containing protein n=1 Tax=Talaromyces proteolyticus TaxID=1131652 RepID=A0AAD4KXK8_9EURO|nr:SAC3/GANP/Nin1/mts3/eIF-3 p25 family-domain-containing protein [Talaromyces proteolyticus]KAH8702384.1 SAC3/GANP/Nin1/mts3/eIF-3 p25 family-domain-containing protein [Talaromyces proteolyticus]
MPKPGSVLGATRASHKDATNSGRGRGRGRSSVNGTKPHTGRHTATSGRGRGQAQSAWHASSGAGTELGGETLTESLSSNSPFAQIKQINNNAFSSANGSRAPLMFGKPSATPETTNVNVFGAPSVVPKTVGSQSHVDPAKDPRRRPTSKRPVQKSSAVSNLLDGAKPVDYQERYEKLKIDRNAKQEERAAKQNKTTDPKKKLQAQTPVGTCTTMCPEYERVERIIQKMIDKSEKSFDPSTGNFEVQELKMIKRFRRSAAGLDEPLPSDIRTPITLLYTMNYLIRHVISGSEPLGLVHKFVWDRTRSIRNDFSVQQVTKIDDVKMAVKCLERIARFHIVSLHLLSSPNNEEHFDHHQEREQLNNTMLSLMHYYDDNRRLIDFPNEAEFRAYYVVLAFHDQRPDIEDRVQRWPREILENPKVQVALDLLAAASNTWEYQSVLEEVRPNVIALGFYERFFSLVDSPSVSYLMGCVAEIYFSSVRQTALRSIWKAYCRVPLSQQHKNEDWTLDELTRTLYFDDDAQTEEFLEEQGLQLMERDDGAWCLNWGSSPIDFADFKASSQHIFSDRYVEVKRGGRTLAALILGLNIQQAATRHMIDATLIESHASDMSVNDDDSELFVGQNEQQDCEQVEPSTDAVNHLVPSSFHAGPLASSPPFLGNNDSPSHPTLLVSSGDAEPQPFQLPKFSATTSIESSKPNFSWPASVNDTTATPEASSKNLFGKQSQPSQSPFSWLSSSQGPSSTVAAPPPPSAEPSKTLFSFVPTFPNSALSDSPGPTITQESKPLFALTPSSFPSQLVIPQIPTTAASTEAPNFLSLESAESPNLPATSSPAINAPSSMAPAPFFSWKPSLSPPETSTSFFKPQPPIFHNQKNQSYMKSASAVIPSATPTDDVMVAHSNETPGLEAGDKPPSIESTPKPDSFTEEYPEEFRQSWIETLRQAAKANRGSTSSRKRPLGAEEIPESAGLKPEIPAFKVQKAVAEEVLKPEPVRQIPKKKSLALASIAPLPTLPILEEVKKMTEPRKWEEDELASSKASQIDEDELLLSAARIAAEQLKNGPKLTGSMPSYAHADSFRSSTSLGRSLNSSTHSHSASPYARINGYDVALAPETPLGLGRTLSRTEQRLRLTGGKGLAYKPLQLTPGKLKEPGEAGQLGKRKKTKSQSST